MLSLSEKLPPSSEVTQGNLVISGVMAKNVCCFFTFLDKRTSQKMPCVSEVKVLDDHDNEFS